MSTHILRRILIVSLGVALIALSDLAAQEAGVEQPDEPVVFTADAVARTTKAINYRSRGGKTKVIFDGTALAKYASGEATVRNKGGATRVDAKLSGLPDPQRFGAEYLTYVLWAISTEGRVVNLGELQRDKRGDAKLLATSELQVFAMVVTAEPYYAVRMPSDVIIAENELTKGTKGRVFFIDAKYELLKRGAYEKLANPLGLSLDLKSNPIDIYQARNALAIAQSVGATEYASAALKRAEASLEMTNSPLMTKGRKKERITLARQAVQFAEDARALTVERIAEEQELERQAITERAKQVAKEEIRKRAAEEEARKRAEADRKKAEEERLEAQRLQIAAQQKALQAEIAAASEARKRADAEAARVAAERAGERARQSAADEYRLRQQAEREKQELRQRILNQLNTVLPTRDTDRGLVVNMGDVLFDTGKYELRATAREKLARITGTVLAFPGLRLQAEGHTDNVGSEELNQKLSENRARSVAEYLVSQGISPDTITSMGFAFSRPVAENTTAAGRQSNRRVELVISGEVIGASFDASRTK